MATSLEIRRIVLQLPTATSVEKLAILIHAVFDKLFSVSKKHTINNCYPTALKIWNKINNSEFPNEIKRQ
ncbi:hypothetical protein MKY29_11360 [Psychrobacillus sp. FSL K6-2365]|uniref:hypothetical protein n=1 Tax=Psychrobacillus sp. FSL K6-2365 TaxID=2921546 RepID=UPI0030F8FE84